jgi:hypothetical protein
VRIDALATGMRVLSQNPSSGAQLFSPIFMWLQHSPELTGLYNRLHTASGVALTLTDFHHVHVAERGCPPGASWARETRLLTSQEALVGQGLWVAINGSFACSVITHIERGVPMAGAFSPVTLAGAIVVDGVLASSSTSYEDILGSRLPTLYLGKRTPPMMLHHALMAAVYRATGQAGLDMMDVLNAPLYWLAKVEHSTNAAVEAKLGATRLRWTTQFGGTVVAGITVSAVAFSLARQVRSASVSSTRPTGR